MSNSPKALEFLVVIPARLGSTRLPRKPLADIHGKPMVVRVADRAMQSAAHSVIVATDAPEIQAVCNEHRIECLLTRNDHPTGTDRIAEIAQLLKLPDNAIVVNVQGDEPLIPAELINQVAQALADHPACAIATVAVASEDSAEIANPNVVKSYSIAPVKQCTSQEPAFLLSEMPHLRQLPNIYVTLAFMPTGQTFYKPIRV